jgi:protocatechuate 3,4-dioxygenase beta subunit
MSQVITRRRALGTIGGFSVAALLAACGSDNSTTSSTSGAAADTDTSSGGSSTTGASATSSGDTSCSTIPSETAGPFPGDGSNGPNVLNQDGVVRTDLRSSFGEFSGTADGIPLTIELTLTDASNGCVPLADAAVYLWHCDAEGRYSLYSSGATEENYLRGVQVSDSNGALTFTSVLPGCYDGRWPHIHFEIYDNLDDATGGGSPRATSQLAFPQEICEEAYRDSRYPSSSANLDSTSLDSDMVFGDDGAAHQLATVTGDSIGYIAALTVAA